MKLDAKLKMALKLNCYVFFCPHNPNTWKTIILFNFLGENFFTEKFNVFWRETERERERVQGLLEPFRRLLYNTLRLRVSHWKLKLLSDTKKSTLKKGRIFWGRASLCDDFCLSPRTNCAFISFQSFPNVLENFMESFILWKSKFLWLVIIASQCRIFWSKKKIIKNIALKYLFFNLIY